MIDSATAVPHISSSPSVDQYGSSEGLFPNSSGQANPFNGNVRNVEDPFALPGQSQSHGSQNPADIKHPLQDAHGTKQQPDQQSELQQHDRHPAQRTGETNGAVQSQADQPAPQQPGSTPGQPGNHQPQTPATGTYQPGTEPGAAPNSVPSSEPTQGGQQSVQSTILPPGQDPYLSPPQQPPTLGQAVGEILGTTQPSTAPVDATEGRLEVGYIDSQSHDDWRVETSEKAYELAEARRREDEEQRRRREEQDEKEREEKAKRFADAMMASMATRRQQELDAARRLQEQQEAARRLQQQNMLAQEKRQKYVVLKGDTLESIAQKKLRDRRLAPLVYEINKRIIPIRTEGTKKLLQLRPRLIILLPTALEVKRYKARLFGRQNTKFEYDPKVADEPVNTSRLTNPGLIRAESTLIPWATRNGVPSAVPTRPLTPTESIPALDSASQKRKANIESLLGSLSSQVEKDGRIRYNCRLGDTLRSVAMRHPALKDHALWRLLAQVNSLSVETDDKGNPVAALKRGTTLVLPTAAEINEFREHNKSDFSPSVKTLGGRQSARTGQPTVPPQAKSPITTDQMDIVCKPCPQCNRITSMNATICPACAYPFDGGCKSDTTNKPQIEPSSTPENKPVKPQSQQSQDNEDDATTSLLLAAGMKPLPPSPVDSRAEGMRNVIAQISETCRIVSFGNMDDSGVGFRTRLEVRQEEFWLPVVRYEINGDASWRHTFNLGGTRKTTRIDLPSRAAKEMAEHDLTTNAQKYSEAFLAGLDINDVV